MPEIENVFSDFEFRSLFARLKMFFQNSQKAIQDDNALRHSHSVLERQVSSGSSEDSSEHNHSELSPVNKKELQETFIALWLINSDITNPSLEDILHFSKTDDFEKAREYIFKQLKEKNLDKVYEEIEKPIIPIVKKMQDYGILIDKKYFENLSKEYHKELDKLTIKIYKMAGTEFNINSPKQLGEVIFGKMGMKSSKKKSASGSFSTKVSVLEELEEDNPIIKEI